LWLEGEGDDSGALVGADAVLEPPMVRTRPLTFIWRPQPPTNAVMTPTAEDQDLSMTPG
jgi:hypothetical protein